MSTGALDVWACKHTPAKTNAHPTVVRVEKKSLSPVDSIRKESDRRLLVATGVASQHGQLFSHPAK